jgi:hypothetical protein
MELFVKKFLETVAMFFMIGLVALLMLAPIGLIAMMTVGMFIDAILWQFFSMDFGLVAWGMVSIALSYPVAYWFACWGLLFLWLVFLEKYPWINEYTTT